MNRIHEHIDQFADLMSRKGYNRLFQSTFGFPGKLKENLIQHVLQCQEEHRKIGPFHMETYTHWVEENQPHIQTNFRVGFSEQKGFEVQHMSLEYRNRYGSIRTKELPVSSNDDIPAAKEVNRMMMERTRNIKRRSR